MEPIPPNWNADERGLFAELGEITSDSLPKVLYFHQFSIRFKIPVMVSKNMRKHVRTVLPKAFENTIEKQNNRTRACSKLPWALTLASRTRNSTVWRHLSRAAQASLDVVWELKATNMKILFVARTRKSILSRMLCEQTNRFCRTPPQKKILNRNTEFNKGYRSRQAFTPGESIESPLTSSQPRVDNIKLAFVLKPLPGNAIEYPQNMMEKKNEKGH